jgi:hypothetical protein
MKMNNMTQKDMVMDVATNLCKANNTATTLEIKIQLRKQYPGSWYQTEISSLMVDLAEDGEFDYIDNGIHRIYSIYDPNNPLQPVAKIPKVKTPVVQGGVISDNRAIDLIKNSRGKFFTIYDEYCGPINGRYSVQTGNVENSRGFSLNINSLDNITKLCINRTVYDVVL